MIELLRLIKLLLQKLRKTRPRKKAELKEILINIKIEKSPALLGKESSLPRIEEREIPLLVLPTNSIPTVHYFMNKNKDLMYGFLLKNLSKAISHNWPFIELFRVGQTPLVARIEKKDYEQSILDMQKFFVESEAFEKAGQCNKLLDKNKINQITDPKK